MSFSDWPTLVRAPTHMCIWRAEFPHIDFFGLHNSDKLILSWENSNTFIICWRVNSDKSIFLDWGFLTNWYFLSNYIFYKSTILNWDLNVYWHIYYHFVCCDTSNRRSSQHVGVFIFEESRRNHSDYAGKVLHYVPPAYNVAYVKYNVNISTFGISFGYDQTLWTHSRKS